MQGDRIWHERGGRDSELDFKQLYAEGKIDGVTLRAGKIPLFDALNLTNGGLVIDSEITGGQVRIPIKDWKIIASGGVIHNDDYDLTRTTTIFHTDSTYLSLQAEGNLNDKISIAAGVHNMHNTAGGLTLTNGQPYSPGGKVFLRAALKKIIPFSRRGLITKLIDIGRLAEFTRRVRLQLPNKRNKILVKVPKRRKVTASS